MPRSGGCCWCCLRCIFTLSLIPLSIWLTLRFANSPTFSIEDFYAFALNRTSNSPHNHTIFFHFKLKNNNDKKGIYYDALHLSFYYNQPNKGGVFIENSSFDGFYQGHHKSAHRYGSVFWENPITAAAPAAEEVEFRVDLETGVRYKYLFWESKRHRVKEKAEVAVNEGGSLVKRKKNKGIKFKSGAGKVHGCNPAPLLLGLIVSWWVLI